MKQGAVDFLPKPVDDDRLIETVTQAIENFSRCTRNFLVPRFSFAAFQLLCSDAIR